VAWACLVVVYAQNTFYREHICSNILNILQKDGAREEKTEEARALMRTVRALATWRILVFVQVWNVF
jgi:hypothetical protein